MQIEKRDVSELKAATYNPRKDLKPGDAEYEKLKRSIQEFGYVEPVIWNKRTGVVVGGHQRLKVMKDLGFTEVDCVVVDLDESKEKALNIALNKISGEWDTDLLTNLLKDLDGSGYDITLKQLAARFGFQLNEGVLGIAVFVGKLLAVLGYLNHINEIIETHKVILHCYTPIYA